jgi:hypothetical protein
MAKSCVRQTALRLGMLAIGLVSASNTAALDDPHEDLVFINFAQARQRALTGTVLEIDDGAIACFVERRADSEAGIGMGLAAADFRFEILTVDVDGVEFRILAPQPTAYAPGDAFNELILTAKPKAFVLSGGQYREDVEQFRVRLAALVSRYTRYSGAIQKGYVIVSGVMDRGNEVRR